jgi:hypothetical protein
LAWLVLWIFTRQLLKGVHFEPFQVHEMKVSQKVGQKVEGWSTNFHKWKGIWIYTRCLNKFPFQIKTPKKKIIVISCAYVHPTLYVKKKYIKG